MDPMGTFFLKKGFLGCKRSVEGLEPWGGVCFSFLAGCKTYGAFHFALTVCTDIRYTIYQEQYVHYSSPIEDLAKFLPVNKNSARIHLYLCLSFFASCILSVIGSTCTLI